MFGSVLDNATSYRESHPTGLDLLGYHSSKLCLLSLVWKNKLPEIFISHKIFFFMSVVLIFLEGASRSPENCLADPKRTADTSFRTTALSFSHHGRHHKNFRDKVGEASAQCPFNPHNSGSHITL